VGQQLLPSGHMGGLSQAVRQYSVSTSLVTSLCILCMNHAPKWYLHGCLQAATGGVQHSCTTTKISATTSAGRRAAGGRVEPAKRGAQCNSSTADRRETQGQAGKGLLLLYKFQGCHCHRPADTSTLFRLFWVNREAVCVLRSQRRARCACVVRV
jgi:hypothetical protein